MISLRGKLEREKETLWKWTGMWSFGATVDSTKALPFRYIWHEPVDPSTVPIPTAKEGNDDEDKPDQNETACENDAVTDEATSKGEPVDTGSSQSAFTESTPSQPNMNDQFVENDRKATEKLDSTQVTAPGTGELKMDSEQDKAAERNIAIQKPTFADESFTDAARSYPEKCPASGQWKGYFKTIGPRKGTFSQTSEHFFLFVNATPPSDAVAQFPDEDEPAHRPLPGTASFPTGHLHARGTGENQYGVFELLGSLHVETSILSLQRVYVRTADSSKSPSPRSKQQRRRAAAIGSTKASADNRPYVTRKRQLSWKRRAALEEGDDTVEGIKNRQKKRARVCSMEASDPQNDEQMTTEESSTMPPNSQSTVTADEMGASASSGQPTIVLPGSHGPQPRRPQSSPRSSAALASSRKHQTSAGSSLPTSSNLGAKHSVGSATGILKLPLAGDPKQARWRAAHFLYYQRHEPISDNINSNDVAKSAITASTNAVSTTPSPKYVIYEGEMLNSQREGRGVCLFHSGFLYEGEWKRNKEHGFGKLMTSDRTRVVYQGEWERGRMHGVGSYHYSSTAIAGDAKIQSKYEGDFKENLRHGDGTYVLPDGSVYTGQWRDGMMSGRGVFTWPDGSLYEGDWKDGKRHGLGVLKVSDGFSYDGNWVRNAMEGRGSATYPNGQQYHGLFTNGRREGRGTMYFTNGAVYEGRFRDDAIDGQGTMKMSRSMVVPSENDDEKNLEKSKKDFMIPVSFQSDMGHIHRKAGFTVGGE
jgi:hypothetical protein